MNKYYQRQILADIEKWLDRREIFAIKGPRQSGKTTLLKIITEHLVKQNGVSESRIIYLSFEDREILDKFARAPLDYVRSFMAGGGEGRYYFLIDEFQYLEDGGQKLKLLYDELENVKFVITGSSSLELTSKTGKYLVGRVFSFYLFQFSFSEFVSARSSQLENALTPQRLAVKEFLASGTDFSVERDIFQPDFLKLYEEYMLWGGYPEVIKANDPATRREIIKNIYDTYLTRDILDLLKVTNTDKFRSMAIMLASQIGSLVNYSSLAGDTKSYFKEVKRFLSILEETFITALPKPWHKNRATELKKNPKVYFIDLGLRNYIINNFNPIDLRPDRGQMAENAVFTALRIAFPDSEIKYWRTLAGAEVDFILRFGAELIPLEVKYSSFNSPKITRGFKNFIQEYEPARACVMTKDYRGQTKVGKTTVKFIPAYYL